MSSQRSADLGVACGTIVVAVAIAATALGFPSSTQRGDPGAALFPLLIAATLVVLGVIRVFRPAPAEQDEDRTGPVLPVLGMLAVGVFSVWAMSWVGFILGAMALLVGGALLAGERRWLRIGVYAVATPLIVYALFVWALELQLPAGPLEAMLV